MAEAGEENVAKATHFFVMVVLGTTIHEFA
jgi:hypothetical protein